MKLQHLSDVPITTAHDNLERQRFIAPGDVQSKTQTVNYVEINPGQSYTPHQHPDCEEFFFILEGTAIAIIDDQEITLNKHDFLIIEKGEIHTFVNKSDLVFRYFQFRVLI